jgi:hypothetical protein
VVFTLIFMATNLGLPNPAVTLPVTVIWMGLVLLVLLRFGLLALIATEMTVNFLWSSPLTLDVSRWYFGYSLVVLLLVAALAAWGFRTALAGRPLFKDETLGG